MRYALYGLNRITKDFLYIFDHLSVVCIFADVPGYKKIWGYQVFDKVDILSKRREYDQIIACGAYGSDLEYLKNQGLIYQRDYLFEKDFFCSLDDPKVRSINPHHLPIVVWGTGRIAGRLAAFSKRYNPIYYIDTYSKQNDFDDKKIKKPQEITEWHNAYIIIAVQKDDSIREFLRNKGLSYETDFVNAIDLMRRPSENLYETIFDNAYYNMKCYTMLNHLELLMGGVVLSCCSAFMEQSIGNVHEHTISDIWHSSLHKIYCLSIVNQTYSFCKKDMCPFFFGRDDEGNGMGRYDDVAYPIMEENPRVCAVGFDNTCNLRCVTCRDDTRVAVGAERETANKLADITIKEILPNCSFFTIAGDGEVFFSPSYAKILSSEEINNLNHIRLLSNGTLFTAKNWEKFLQDKRGEIILTVSVDAATKETYEKIRRGGDFAKLKNNMIFASNLRREGRLSYFRMNFVVQKENYREMPLFVQWGLELGVDEIFFTKILNWGTYTPENFSDISMMESDGITPKKELQEILQQPLLHNKIVDLGTIKCVTPKQSYIEIENYYMWELERKVPSLFSEM